MRKHHLRAPLRLGPIDLVDRDVWILQRVRGHKVLHAGATDNLLTEGRASADHLLHQKLRKADCDLTGVDIDGDGISLLKEKYGIDDIVCGDLEALDTTFPNVKFDVILAADVMEHLSNPGLFLTSARKVLAKDGEIVITVPNAFSFKKFIGVSIFREERNHPDHVCFYSLMNLHQLLHRFGLNIVEVHGFMIVDPNRRRANVWANRFAFLTMTLLRNNNIADELAIVAKAH